MKILMLAERGAELARLVQAVREIKPDSVRASETWDGFLRALQKRNPDVVVLCYSKLVAEGLDGVLSADAAIKDLEVPAVVALAERYARDEASLRRMTEFGHFLHEPYDAASLSDAIGKAMEQPARDDAETPPAGNDAVRQQALDSAVARSTPIPEDEQQETTSRITHLTSDAGEERSGANEGVALADEPAQSTRAHRISSEVLPTGGAVGGSNDDVREELSKSDVAAIQAEKVFESVASDDDEIAAEEVGDFEERESSRLRKYDARAKTVVPSEDGPITHAPPMPPLEQGSIEDVSVPRLLFAHFVSSSTGKLVLRQGTILREFELVEGELGFVGRKPTPEDHQKLAACFVWEEGTYRYDAGQSSMGTFHSFGDPLALIYHGVCKGLPLNQIANALTPYLRLFPAVTNRAETFQRKLSKLPGLLEFYETVSGSDSFETIIARRGAEAPTTLRNTFFSLLTDAIVFLRSPSKRPVKVVYSEEVIGDRIVFGQTFDGRTTETTISEASVEEEDEVLEKLRRKAERFGASDPYKAFRVRRGCGRKVVRERYYRLVKDNHPDVYSQIQDPEAKDLAERLFVNLREHYQRLLQLEKTDAGEDRSTGSHPWTRAGSKRSRKLRRGISGEHGTVDTRSDLGASASSPGSESSSGSRGSADTGAKRREPAPSTSAGSSARNGGDGEPKKVSEVLERLNRRRAAQKNAGAAAPRTGPRHRRVDKADDGGGTSTATPPPAAPRERRTNPGGARAASVSPAQHMRNARRSLNAAAYEKALESTKAAIEGGLEDDAEAKAYAYYLEYVQKLTEGPRAIAALRSLKAEIKSHPRYDELAALIELFLGHVYRLEENDEKALEHYEAVIDLRPDSIEAARYIRLFRKRQKNKDNLFSRLFQTKAKK